MTDWTVLRQNGSDSGGRRRVWCRCKCGTERCVDWNNVRTGRSSSCGCVKQVKGAIRERYAYTHVSWQGMRTRCLNPYSADFERYGGRGITICTEWDSFLQFVADMGERPADLTLDRIDPDGPYCKSNCRWATAKLQRANQRPHKRSVK